MDRPVAMADAEAIGFGDRVTDPGLGVTQLADLGVARSLDAAGAELAPILARHLTRR